MKLSKQYEREDRRLINSVLGVSLFCVMVGFLHLFNIQDEVIPFLGYMMLLIGCVLITDTPSDRFL